MIKNIDRCRYIYFNTVNGKIFRSIVNILTIFVLLTTLLVGSTASSWNVYGQPNETDSQSENVVKIIPNTTGEQNNEDTDGQLTLGNGSAENDSENTSESQITTEESNTQIVADKSQPDGDCLFDPSTKVRSR